MCLLVYRFLVWLFLPCALLRLAYKGIKQPAYFRHWGERLGITRLASADLWIHGVSLGESKIALLLAQEIRKQYASSWGSNIRIHLSCTTPTARTVLDKWAAHHPHTQVSYLAFDCALLHKRLLRAVSPRAFITIETELWPNLLTQAHQLGVRCWQANARLSRTSARRQRRVLHLFRPILNRLHVLASDNNSARRIERLAGSQGCASLAVCKNMKYDHSPTPDEAFTASIASLSTPDDGGLRIVFASMRRDETPELLLQAHQLLTTQPQHRIIWIPRHPEQDGDLLRRMLDTYFPQKWCNHAEQPHPAPIVVLNSYGHSIDAYAVADIVIMGGSFGTGGSHNVIEPGLLAKPIIAGPSQHNFAQVHRILARNKGIVHLRCAQELNQHLLTLIASPSMRHTIGGQAQRTLCQMQGAVQLQAQYIVHSLGEVQK